MAEGKKKLLLIQPSEQVTTASLRKSKWNSLPWLGLGYVAALTPKDWDVELIDENVEEFKFRQADLVGITGFTCTISRAYRIASIYREAKIPVVMGGIHVSMLPHEAARYANSIVIGEAEGVWGDVIADFEKGSLKTFYTAPLTSLEHMVVPRRDFFGKSYHFATVQTSRGCPFNCEYCSVTRFNGNVYRQRPVDEVLSELANIPQRRIFFVDDNMFGYGKQAEERAVSLFKGMIQKRMNKLWFAQTSINFAENDEALDLAVKSGCRGVFIGFESILEDSLVTMGKKINMSSGVHNYGNVIRKLHEAGIIVLAGMMIAIDGEGEDTFVRTYNFLKHSKVDALQLAITTPWPGTALYGRLEKDGRIAKIDYPEDWKDYSGLSLVLKHDKLSERTLYDGFHYIVRTFYSRMNILKRIFSILMTSRKLSTTYLSLILNNIYRRTYKLWARDNENSLTNGMRP